MSFRRNLFKNNTSVFPFTSTNGFWFFRNSAKTIKLVFQLFLLSNTNGTFLALASSQQRKRQTKTLENSHHYAYVFHTSSNNKWFQYRSGIWKQARATELSTYRAIIYIDSTTISLLVHIRLIPWNNLNWTFVTQNWVFNNVASNIQVRVHEKVSIKNNPF